MANDFDVDAIADVMATFLSGSISKMQKNLDDSKSNNSGALRQSIGENLSKGVIVDGESVSMTISLDDYYAFVDEGVQGAGGTSKYVSGKTFTNQNTTSSFKYTNKPPPYVEILKGVKTKTNKIAGFSDGFRALLIQESIFGKGTKPTNFFSDVINEKTLDKFIAQLFEASAESVELNIGNIVKTANKK